MKRSLLLSALCALLAVGCTNVRTVGDINGNQVTRITTRGVFSPSTTTIVLSNTNRPGTIDGVIANANGNSLLGQVSQPAASAAAAYLLKPDTTRVNVGANANGVGVGTGGNGNGGSGGAGGNGGSGGQFIPPGHLGTNPGNGH